MFEGWGDRAWTAEALLASLLLWEGKLSFWRRLAYDSYEQ